jgi:REP element-mobilizing transposase RayT
MSGPLAYFITFTCYGTWLHGDDRGSVDDDHNVIGTPMLGSDPHRRTQEREQPNDMPYSLDLKRRRITLEAIHEIARRKTWAVHAIHVRSSHVHVVLTADGPPERVMNDLKAAASRRLNKQFPEEHERTRWTRHGSTRYLWSDEAVVDKVRYVLEGQGEPMERYPP